MTTLLFGNPNTGKTSFFNQITGSYEYVGNWSGVTVEKKQGVIRNGKHVIVDLPGVYSLNPISNDEKVASLALLEGHDSQLLNVVNANQLERSLYLTIELMETGLPISIALNMHDLARQRGVHIDTEKLEKRLGVSVHTTVARKGKGFEKIIDELQSHTVYQSSDIKVQYPSEIEAAILKMQELLTSETKFSTRWLVIQYLSNNPIIQEYVDQNHAKIQVIKADVDQKLADKGIETQDCMIETRSSSIEELLEGVITYHHTTEKRTLTDYIDLIATNRFLGIPFFLFLLYIVFELTFEWLGFPLSNLLDAFFSGPLTTWTTEALNAIHAQPFLKSVVLDGIIAGVGGVLVFVPQIFILFFFISLLEDSGYMARVAVVMDRLMEFIGLNGKAFIPLVIGFGCNVPAVMAARTVEQPRERLLTILLTPLMSCSARLSVYSLFVAAFFQAHQALIVLSLYVLGIVVAICVAKIFSFFIKNEHSYFVMELPPYNIPQAKQLFRSTWDKGKGFVRKAGTFIFGGSVFIWLLSYLGPGGMNVSIDDSFMAKVSSVFTPLLHPLGFDSWQAVSALITGFLAKEVVVSTMNVLYHVPNGVHLSNLLPHYFTPLSAYSFLVFVLLYTPCLSTVAAIQKETGSNKWTFVSIAYSLIVAYILSFSIYHIGQWMV